MSANTHITIILDRSGSMDSIRSDVIGGFNAFLAAQMKEKGKATLTLVQFDTQEPYEVIHMFKPIETVPELDEATYVPRAATPLLDALGRAINDLEKNIYEMKKAKRPDKVVMVVITDGQENSSEEFRKDQIIKMINKRQEKDNWQFVFLSADLDAIQDAGEYGFHHGSTMAFDKNSAGVAETFLSLSGRVTAFRTSHAMDVSFTDEDRSKQKNEKKKKK